jgi:F-type H+-transporting ATPase subunit gamma
MDFSVSKDVAEKILNLYLQEDYIRIDVLYNEFKSAIQQDIIVKQLLPIIPIESENISKLDFLYEPDEDTIIEELGRKYIHVDIWRIMLESSAAEQGARMTAMDSATDNAADMIDNLTLFYNRARQAVITKEIIEIASGAEASQQ